MSPTVQSRLSRLLPYFLRYVLIGGGVFVLDIGSFQAMISHDVYRPLATTLSYLMAISTHFCLNRYLNFRNFERSGARQLQTYLVVSGFCWVVTMVVIEAGVELGFTPLAAKIVAVAINVPIGFVGHKFLTFGQGLGYWLRSLRT